MSEQSIAERAGYYKSMMQPIPGDHPCGKNLEYDPAFIMLQTKLQPKQAAEYGNFVEVAEPSNWTDIERKCLELLNNSRDIRLFIILMRCRMRQVGVGALQEGLEALLWCLDTWPDQLHPQLFDEGEFEPLMRGNAFAELEDVDGFIADFRNQQLPKAAGMQISIKEFEKAHSVPREEGALEEGILEAIKQEWQDRSDPTILSLQKAYTLLQGLITRLNDSLGEDAPDFVRMTSVLRHFDTAITPTAPTVAPESLDIPEVAESYPVATEIPTTAEAQTTLSVEVPQQRQPVVAQSSQVQSAPIQQQPIPSQPKGIQNRADALSRLVEVREWFTVTEPSSPIIALLAFSEKTIGKSFGELLQFIPQELISKLNEEQE
jgi:type VI secretion system protein ImpA